VAGVAGVGMSALAEALLDADAAVSGSDRLWDRGDASPVVAKLVAQGLAMCPQDGTAITAGMDALVVSTAIEADNPERQAAERLGVPIRHRAEVLAELLADRPLIAVAGTCGKSTTTAMLGVLLAGCGLDPTVVNGAAVVDWRSETRTGSVRRGAGPWCVAEVDESDRSLLRFHPVHAILTNASADHFPLDATLELFSQFRAQVSGIVIDGVRGDAQPPAFEPLPWGSRFRWQGQGYAVPIPGIHNSLNAWQAVRMALALGLAPVPLATALAGFRGVDRRLERVGVRPDGVPVVDDYAHNTEKLRAVWRTLAEGHRRVLGLWRPHGYGPLRAMLDSLTAMFAETCRPDDRLYLMPVYDAGGTADRSIGSGVLAERLGAAGVQVTEVATHADAITQMSAEVRAGDVLATFGARDPDLPRTARKLLIVS
jgi:UDP-N-acetylmuramate--alanine ligase